MIRYGGGGGDGRVFGLHRNVVNKLYIFIIHLFLLLLLLCCTI